MGHTADTEVRGDSSFHLSVDSEDQSQVTRLLCQVPLLFSVSHQSQMFIILMSLLIKTCVKTRKERKALSEKTITIATTL